MFKLFVLIVVLIQGVPVVNERVVHRDTFKSAEACAAQFVIDEGTLREALVPQLPAEAELVLKHECLADETSASDEDRAADEIARIFGLMNAAGGIGAVR